MSDGGADAGGNRPDPRVVKARRAEVKQRYQRESRRKNNGGIRLGELRRLLRHRRVPEEQVADEIQNFGNLYDWSATELGEWTELTWCEQLALGIRTFRCTDRKPEQVAEYFRGKKRERDRMRLRNTRALAPQQPAGLSDRAGQLLGLLSEKWTPRGALVAATTNLPAYRRLKYSARKQAVRRALAELEPAGRVDIDANTFDENGQPVVVVRLHV